MKTPQLAGCHRSGSRSRACLPGLLKGAAARGPGAGRGAGGGPRGGAGWTLTRPLGAGGRGVLNPTPSNTFPWPRLGARPKSRIPAWVANFHPKTGRGEGAGDGVSRSLLRALGSPFRGGLASQLSLRPTSGEARGSSGCGAPGLSARLLERGFPGNTLPLGCSRGFPVTREGGEPPAGLSPAEPRSSRARRAWGKTPGGTGRAGETQPFEVRLRGNAPTADAGSDARAHLSAGGSGGGF